MGTHRYPQSVSIITCLRYYDLCMLFHCSKTPFVLHVSGLFCMHLVRLFTHLQVEKIPSKYILKRYTRFAKSQVSWDRHDIVPEGTDARPEQYRIAKLIPVAMSAVRVGSKSEYACQKTMEELKKITQLVVIIPEDVGPSS